VSAISEQDYRDQEDGRALRKLDALLPPRDAHYILRRILPTAWEVRVYNVDDPRGDAGGHYGNTIAAAADACREALVAK